MPRRTDAPWLARCVRRGQPLLGTLVTLLLEPLSDAAGDRCDDDAAEDDSARLHAAAAAAFAAIAHVGRVMSAHCATSDLGRLARTEAGCATAITLDPHTVRVLCAAQHWQRLSTGAFDSQAAARPLVMAGLRPALKAISIHSSIRLGQLRFTDIDQVLADGPLALDLGGIAKGYAVDLAIETLQQHGVTSGLVNAGGDMRAFGPRRWPVAVASRGSARPPIDVPRTLCNAALATSETGWHGSEMIATARLGSRQRAQRNLSNRKRTSHCCTVQAPDCISADAFTKWALQANSRAASIRLTRVLRANRASLWRSA